jgi:diapolycopene oxygenase
MNSKETVRVGVIGGGLGGLAAACTLAARGYRVVLLERNRSLGGKAALLEEQGYRFDLGPTILTIPSVLARIYAEAGRRMADHLQLTRLDPQWRCFFDDGSILDLREDAEQMAMEIARFSLDTDDADGYRRFLNRSGRLNAIAQRFFFWRPVGSLRDMFDARTALQPSMLRAILDVRPGQSVAATVRTHVRDARVAQMLDHFTQYVGSAPDQSPAVLCGIAHMQTNEGVWYPRGGMNALARALESLARELGVEIRKGGSVRRILLDSKTGVRGVETDRGEEIPLAAIVANSDIVRTHRDLIGGVPKRRFDRQRRYEPSCSGVVLYLGLDRSYEHLAHHNFVFSHDPAEEFDAIYRRGEPAPDPTCYLAAPSRTEPDVAPPGGEALYVLVHVPYLRPHHDWDRLLPAYRRTILDKLVRTAGLRDLEQRIRFERWLTPQDIQDRFGVWNGAIYGLASHGKLLGAFKPSNRSSDVKGLYFAGGSAHPGPGVPMVLMSGWIAAYALDADGIVPRMAPGCTTPSEVALEASSR